jgi:hypothetical protein
MTEENKPGPNQNYNVYDQFVYDRTTAVVNLYPTPVLEFSQNLGERYPQGLLGVAAQLDAINDVLAARTANLPSPTTPAHAPATRTPRVPGE